MLECGRLFAYPTHQRHLQQAFDVERAEFRLRINSGAPGRSQFFDDTLVGADLSAMLYVGAASAAHLFKLK
jgi:hypothetical protein